MIVERIGTLPIKEVSGLALRVRAGAREVLAIGDKDFSIAVGALVAGEVPSFEVADLRRILRDGGGSPGSTSQWEAIAADAAGRVFVLEEDPGHVFVLSPALDALESVIALDVPALSPDPDVTELAPEWARNPNSRGEGLVLLEGGHLLVLKEKRPRRLIEFGPEGDAPLGLRLLGDHDPFEMPAGPAPRMVPLRVWKFDEASDESFPDVVDLAADSAGELWVLSDERAALGRIVSERGAERLGILRVADLSGVAGLEKPEGLVVLRTGVALVACDDRVRGRPIFAVALDD